MNKMAITIARELKERILGVEEDSSVSIFLCGGAGKDQDEVRRDLGAAIRALQSRYRYSVYYPESMFIEVALGHKRLDMLTLENLLAQSVSVVVILLQSPGTFTELGAFSNHHILKQKLVVVVDPKYKNAKSFINEGPLRHLQKETTSRILYLDICKSNLDVLVKDVSEAARAIAGKYPPTRDLSNPIICYELYLAMLYVFDPMPRIAFAEIAGVLHPDNVRIAQAAAETVANGLINNGHALLVSRNVSISSRGVERLFSWPGSVRRCEFVKKLLFSQRVLALNAMLRKRYKKFWGETA